MTSSTRRSASLAAAFAITLFGLLAAISTQPAHAQTFTVLHNFNSFPDGKTPRAGLSMDTAGNLYGTASLGGDPDCDNGFGCGSVFRLRRTTHGWVAEVLYIFHGPNGAYPYDRVVFGPDGALYGTASGGETGQGVIFRLTPPPSICHAASCPWTETLLYQFQGTNDGYDPVAEVLFDHAGNFYGTAESGQVYEMTRSGAGWTFSVIYTFTGGDNGERPYAGVTFDQAGNLYGTTWIGGTQNYGTVYELTPFGGLWHETVLHSFVPFLSPYAGVIFDQAGNLFGATAANGSAGGASAYELTHSSGGWNFTTIAGIGGSTLANLTLDSAGNLYGTASSNISGQCGVVYELRPQNGSWVYTVLHAFQGSDGCQPESSVLIDASGNLYGTTTAGGANSVGVIWEITP